MWIDREFYRKFILKVISELGNSKISNLVRIEKSNSTYFIYKKLSVRLSDHGSKDRHDIKIIITENSDPIKIAKAIKKSVNNRKNQNNQNTYEFK